MIYKETILAIGDNSGGLNAKCIHNYSSSPAKIGSMIKLSVLKTLSLESDKPVKVKKGELFKAVIINTNKELKRKNGFIIKMNSNVAILLNIQGKMVGSRVFYMVPYESRKASLMKLFSLAPAIV